MKNYNKLIDAIRKAANELEEVDVSKAPTNSELDMLEDLRRVAHSLQTIVSYIIDG